MITNFALWATNLWQNFEVSANRQPTIQQSKDSYQRQRNYNKEERREEVEKVKRIAEMRMNYNENL